MKSFNTDEYVSGLSIDCVIMGYNKKGINILVIKWKGMNLWALPGGFILKGEDLEIAATRILEERTGLTLPYLQQFHTFGNADRGNGPRAVQAMKTLGKLSSRQIDWLSQRFISTGYLSLLNMEQSKPTPDLLSDRCEWKPISQLPDLIFDHTSILEKAMEHLKNQINYLPIGISLLPEKFTMKSLQHLYESITKRKFDRGNFQKKMLKLGFLIRHEKQLTGGAHKAPFLYSFDAVKYSKLVEKGIGFL